MQTIRLLCRQVPPELILLSHHQGEAATVLVLPLPGNVTHHLGTSAGRVDHAAKQFQCRRFAGTVGSQKSDEFALLHIEIDAADRLNLAVLAFEQPANAFAQTFAFPVNAIGLGQLADFDDRHRERGDEDSGGRNQG